MRKLNKRQVQQYLKRLQISCNPAPTWATLKTLHLAHLRIIPFKNLDIHLGLPIKLNIDKIIEKMTGDRGGFCYELNGAFAALLETLGFSVDLLEARVIQNNTYSQPFDHLCLRVNNTWLADVGFGDSFLAPLPLRLDEDLEDPNGTYHLSKITPTWSLTPWTELKRYNQTHYILVTTQDSCLSLHQDAIIIRHQLRISHPDLSALELWLRADV